MNTVKVLMIEDNPGDVVLVQEAVAKVGLPYHITVLHDGAQATEYLERSGKFAGVARPDFIILDLKLPRMSGQEVINRILPDPVLHKIPLVVLSSSRSELSVIRSRNLPARSCMTKPSTFTGYVELVKAMEVFRQETIEGKAGNP